MVLIKISDVSSQGIKTQSQSFSFFNYYVGKKIAKLQSLWFLAFHLLMSLIQIVARWKADNGRTDLPPPQDKAKKYINLKNRIVQVTKLYNKSNSASLPNDIICEYSEKGNSTCKILRVAS